MTRHPFTPAAKLLWGSIPVAAQEDILNNVWCGDCRSSRQIVDFTGVCKDGDVRLQGFCSECGHIVVRIVETSEAQPPSPGK
jgi:hypothetical protein